MQKPYKKNDLWGYFFILPTMFMFVLFVLVPIVDAVRFSLTDSNFATANFIGLRNYTELFQDKVFMRSFGNTLLFVLYLVPATIVLSLFFAVVLMRSGSRVRTLFRSVFYLPVVVSVVPLCVVFSWMLNPSFGFVNYFLSIFGIPPANLLGNPDTALITIAAIYLLFTIGQPLILYMAAIGGIPQSYYEAAELDGAGEWKKFSMITFHLIMPTNLYVFIMTTINAFQCFAVVQIMTGGGPNYASSTVLFLIYQYAFDFNDFGKACAMSVILCVTIAVLSMIQMKFMSASEEY